MTATLVEQFPQLALLPAIPLSVKSAESTAEQTSVLKYMPRSPVAVAYRDAAAWLEAHAPAQAMNGRKPAPTAGARHE
jgi:chromosome partitioning protein